jgi:4-amino-4-deoxy-L-arabinose transferase-like glycosyltransferase
MKRNARAISASALSFFIPLAIYAASAYHDVMYWDIGEMDTVPYILGIAHPPGFPLYTLVGWAFTHLVPVGSVAWRMSLLSGLAMALAAWFVGRIVVDERGDRIAGLCAALLFALGGVAWAHATRAEAHAFVVLADATLLCFLLRWYHRGRNRDLYVVAVTFGLGIALHPVVAFVLPGMLAAIVARAHESEMQPMRRAAALAAIIAAVCFLYLPLRSASVNAERLDPLVAYGIEGNAFWNYDDPVVAENFMSLVTGREVDVGSAHFGYTAAAFAQGAVHVVRAALVEATPVGCVLALTGAIVLLRRSLTTGIIVCATLLPGAVFAFGFAAESDVERYFLPAFALLAIATGETLASARPARTRAAAFAAAALVAVYLLVSQRNFFAQPRDDRAAREAAEIVHATPGDAIVIATWVIAPPLAYDDYVLRATGDRVIVPAWYGDQVDRIAGWASRHPVFVAGTPEGSVPGFHLERMRTHTELYAVVRNR